MDEKYYEKLIKYLIDELEDQTFWRNFYEKEYRELADEREHVEKKTNDEETTA